MKMNHRSRSLQNFNTYLYLQDTYHINLHKILWNHWAAKNVPGSLGRNFVGSNIGIILISMHLTNACR